MTVHVVKDINEIKVEDIQINDSVLIVGDNTPDKVNFVSNLVVQEISNRIYKLVELQNVPYSETRLNEVYPERKRTNEFLLINGKLVHLFSKEQDSTGNYSRSFEDDPVYRKLISSNLKREDKFVSLETKDKFYYAYIFYLGENDYLVLLNDNQVDVNDHSNSSHDLVVHVTDNGSKLTEKEKKELKRYNFSDMYIRYQCTSLYNAAHIYHQLRKFATDQKLLDMCDLYFALSCDFFDYIKLDKLTLEKHDEVIKRFLKNSFTLEDMFSPVMKLGNAVSYIYNNQPYVTVNGLYYDEGIIKHEMRDTHYYHNGYNIPLMLEKPALNPQENLDARVAYYYASFMRNYKDGIHPVTGEYFNSNQVTKHKPSYQDAGGLIIGNNCYLRAGNYWIPATRDEAQDIRDREKTMEKLSTK